MPKPRHCWSVPEEPDSPVTCPHCGLSDIAQVNLRSAIEARCGRPLISSEFFKLLEAVGQARCDAFHIHESVESYRRGAKILRDLQAEKKVYQKVAKDMNEQLQAAVQAKLQQWVEPLEHTVDELNDVITSLNSAIWNAEGRALALNASRLQRVELSPLSVFEARSNKKWGLEVLTCACLRAWTRFTGDVPHEVRIGHPDHAGPFLLFLLAAAEKMPGGVTLNSLHAKARELTGRRGRKHNEPPPESPTQ